MGDLGSFRGALDGASAHEASWLEATVAALRGQGVATIADLEGAAFEDFSFADKELDAAQKRLVRAGIAAASTPAPVAGGPAAAALPAPSAAENAAALLAALKTGTSEAQAVSPRSRARVAQRGAFAGKAGPRAPGPYPRQGVAGQPPARVLAQARSRARWISRLVSCAGSSDMLDALNAEVVKRQKKESSEEARVFLYADIRKWVPDWARSGPRDDEEEADAATGVSKDIRDLAKARAPRALPCSRAGARPAGSGGGKKGAREEGLLNPLPVAAGVEPVPSAPSRAPRACLLSRRARQVHGRARRHGPAHVG